MYQAIRREPVSQFSSFRADALSCLVESSIPVQMLVLREFGLCSMLQCDADTVFLGRADSVLWVLVYSLM